MSGTLAAITASSQLRRWSQALDLLESSRHLRVKPSAALYTAAIDACGAGGHWASAVKLFDELQSMMTPDVVCFGAVIAALSTSTVWERCLATLTSMYEWRIDINIACATEAVPASDHAMHARRMSITIVITITSIIFSFIIVLIVIIKIIAFIIVFCSY